MSESSGSLILSTTVVSQRFIHTSKSDGSEQMAIHYNVDNHQLKNPYPTQLLI